MGVVVVLTSDVNMGPKRNNGRFVARAVAGGGDTNNNAGGAAAGAAGAAARPAAAAGGGGLLLTAAGGVSAVSTGRIHQRPVEATTYPNKVCARVCVRARAALVF